MRLTPETLNKKGDSSITKLSTPLIYSHHSPKISEFSKSSNKILDKSIIQFMLVISVYVLEEKLHGSIKTNNVMPNSSK